MRSRFVLLMLSPITDFTSMESHDTRVSAISSHPAAFSCLRGLLRIPPLPKRCADSAIGKTNWLATLSLRPAQRHYPGSVAFIMYMRRIGIKTAVVTSSENCQAVLRAAKVEDLFDGCVDGKTLVEYRLAGKPAPDSFLKAAEMLRVIPQHAVVIEDAISGVRAGVQGGFGLVIGVARKDNAEELKSQGANVVVNDLAELLAGSLARPLEVAA